MKMMNLFAKVLNTGGATAAKPLAATYPLVDSALGSGHYATSAKKKQDQADATIKRPPSAYTLFIKKSSDRFGGQPASSVIKALAEEWNRMPQVQKTPYESESGRLRKEFHDAKQLANPKRPANSFSLFLKSTVPMVRRANPNRLQTECFKMSVDKWNALSDAEKQPFVARAKMLRQQFDAAHPKEPKPPRSRAVSAYVFFVQDAMKKRSPGVKASDAMRQIAAKWQGLSQTDKMQYEMMAIKDKERIGAMRDAPQ